MLIETIPLGLPFIKTLALALYQENINNPHDLAKQIIIMPTQRGCSALEQAFCKITSHLLLPKILPLADLQNSFFSKLLPPDDSLPTINIFERLGLLTKLLQKFKKLNIWQSHQYAVALIELFDDLNIHDIPLDKVKELSMVQDDLKDDLNFLSLLADYWPQILKEQGKIEPQSAYKNFIKKLCNFFDVQSFFSPIIIAGTTGSMPSTQALIASVLRLPQGRLILPGFDPTETKIVPPFHPQWTMQQLLQKLPTQEVKYLNIPTPKTAWIRNLMDIEAIVDSGPALESNEVTLIETHNLISEAKIIATIMRYHYQEEDKTITLVTSHPNLGHLVQQELSRWEIVANQSLGIPLNNTSVGQFFSLTSYHLVPDIFKIMATLKHPLAIQEQLEEVQNYELYLRKTESDWSIQPSGEITDNLLQFWKELRNTFINNNFSPYQVYEFKDLLNYHIQLTEKLSEKLYMAQGNKELKEFLKDLSETAQLQPKITPMEYPVLFKQLLDCTGHFNEIQTNKRLLILGTLEARLNNADIIILGNLNEGSWPKIPQDGPWLSSNMRKQIGLPPLEKLVGLAAHDFCANFCAQKIYITKDSQEASSRFWIRLETMAKLQKLDLTSKNPWAEWAEALDQNNKILKPITPPKPNPSIDDRPRELASSHIELLMRDPYGFYARKCLNLIPLNELITQSSYRERGNAFHQFLENFFNNPNLSLDELFNIISKSSKCKIALNFWQPQLANLYKWLCDFYKNNSPRQFLTEKRGEFKIDDLTIFARADRVDQVGGKTIIIDYKTTTPATLKDITNGFSPQLAVESLITHYGGFGNTTPLSHAEIWHVTGKADATVEIIDYYLDLQDTKNGIEKLIKHYTQNPYLVCPIPEKAPSYNNYEHLERIKEWG